VPPERLHQVGGPLVGKEQLGPWDLDDLGGVETHCRWALNS
jgi:hypothetical protein